VGGGGCRPGWEMGRAAAGEVAGGRGGGRDGGAYGFGLPGFQWPPVLEDEIGGGGGPAVVAVQSAAEARQCAGVGSLMAVDCGGVRRVCGRRPCVVGGRAA
jgi:hypothetical protein